MLKKIPRNYSTDGCIIKSSAKLVVFIGAMSPGDYMSSIHNITTKPDGKDGNPDW